MSGQFSRKTIELDRQMREFDFGMWADEWKCNKCTFQTEKINVAKNHAKTHKKLEEFGIKI